MTSTECSESPCEALNTPVADSVTEGVESAPSPTTNDSATTEPSGDTSRSPSPLRASTLVAIGGAASTETSVAPSVPVTPSEEVPIVPTEEGGEGQEASSSHARRASIASQADAGVSPDKLAEMESEAIRMKGEISALKSTNIRLQNDFAVAKREKHALQRQAKKLEAELSAYRRVRPMSVAVTKAVSTPECVKYEVFVDRVRVHYTVQRRYSEFRELMKAIVKEAKGLQLPIMPPRHFFRRTNVSDEMVERRRKELDMYLKQICVIDAVRDCAAMVEFLKYDHGEEDDSLVMASGRNLTGRAGLMHH